MGVQLHPFFGTLYALLGERDDRDSVLQTDNLSFSKWVSIFKDPKISA